MRQPIDINTVAEDDRKLIEGYIEHMEDRGLSRNTIHQRECLLIKMSNELGLSAGTTEIRRWVNSMNYTAKSKSICLSHLSVFYAWARKERLIARNPMTDMPRPKINRGLPRPISDADLLKALDEASQMVKIWLLLGAYEGLRCQEMAGLKREDIMPKERLLRVTDAKGGAERIVPLHPEVWEALRGWWKLPKSGYIFQKYGKSDDWRKPLKEKMSPNYISSQISTHLKSLDIESTPHSLRHWFATRLLASTHDLRVVGETLGHRDINSTLVYADWDREVAKAGVWALKVSTPKPVRKPRKPAKPRMGF